MDRRIRNLEQRLGPVPDPGRLVLISPNAWSDADRDAWERGGILHDIAAKDDLIETHTGYRPQHRPGVVEVVVVPAPQGVEDASEEERERWRDARRTDAWKE